MDVERGVVCSVCRPHGPRSDRKFRNLLAPVQYCDIQPLAESALDSTMMTMQYLFYWQLCKQL